MSKWLACRLGRLSSYYFVLHRAEGFSPLLLSAIFHCLSARLFGLLAGRGSVPDLLFLRYVYPQSARYVFLNECSWGDRRMREDCIESANL